MKATVKDIEHVSAMFKEIVVYSRMICKKVRTQKEYLVTISLERLLEADCNPDVDEKNV